MATSGELIANKLFPNFGSAFFSGNKKAGGGDVYAYNTRTYLPDKDALYKYVKALTMAGRPAEEVANQLSNNPFGVSFQELYNAGYKTGGGGGGGSNTRGYSYDPNHDAGAINQYKSKIGGLQPTLNDLFNQIYAGINTQADQQRAEAQQNYNTQQQGLTNTFTKNLGSNAAAYTSRNAYDSSFRANAEDQIRNDYNTQTTANNQALSKNLANIGQYVAQNRASIDASKPNYNLNDYGDVSSLSGLYNQLSGLQTTLKEKLAGLGSNDTYKNLLASSVPYQSTQSQAVVDQLNKLAGTTVSPQDKLTAASGYISQLPDQNSKDYWQNYYQNLVKQQQPQGA